MPLTFLVEVGIAYGDHTWGTQTVRVQTDSTADAERRALAQAQREYPGGVGYWVYYIGETEEA